jgi:hypothetical protein
MVLDLNIKSIFLGADTVKNYCSDTKYTNKDDLHYFENLIDEIGLARYRVFHLF